MTILCAYHEHGVTFLQHCASGAIAKLVAQGVRERFDHGYQEAEYRSWGNSLPALARVLESAGVTEIDVFIELQMPLSSERCDVLLLGQNGDGAPMALVIELKQWSYIKESVAGYKLDMMGRPVLHPAVQARDYTDWLRCIHGAFTGSGVSLSTCAYLHNMTSKRAIDLLRSQVLFGSALNSCALFAADNAAELGDFIRRKVGHGRLPDGRELILNAELAAAKNLLALLVQTIEGNADWILLSEQRLVFEQVIARVTAAREQGRDAPSYLIIVRGGPGTGKSVLAIQLLAYGARQGWRVTHSTGSKAFHTVLQAKVEHLADEWLKKVHNARYKKDIPVRKVFTTFRDIASLGAKQGRQLDLVIGDEGHRLWNFRLNPRTRKPQSDTPMIEEVLRAAPVTVMFLDNNQSIRANEIGSVQYLQEQASCCGVSTEVLELDTQFRCGGSVSYMHWVENRMGFDRPLSIAWRQYDGYDFRIFSDVGQMQRDLAALVADGQRCRMVAGFCWKWSEPKYDGSLVADLSDPRFGDWSAPWIEKGDQYAAPSEHRYHRWIEDDACFTQVGSIYSIQGFEFDYVGVIIGDDLVIRDGLWCADLSKNKDGQFKDDLRRSSNQSDPVDAATRLRNIYQVLLTRAMKGTFVFFLDQDTRRHFEAALAAPPSL